MSYSTYQLLNYCWMAIAAVVFISLFKVTAPYGRHTSTRWGVLVDNRLGWLFMEGPSVFVLLGLMLTNLSVQNVVTWVLAAFFIFHYINRSFIFPFRIRTKSKKMPALIMVFGMFFNLINAFLLGYYFAHFARYDPHDLFGWRFIGGAVLFILGVSINWDYDNRLIHLRKPGETGYKIPEGGLFNWVSCPNLLGEIIEWTGYAILCWNLPAASFLVWTFANLIPRAYSHHRWYKSHFSDYPAKRKAVIPFVF